jgi:hypothetical protein
VDAARAAYSQGRQLLRESRRKPCVWNRWSLIVQLQWLRCNTLQKEKLENKNLHTKFLSQSIFFRDAPMRAPFRVQSVKTRSFAASLQSLTVVFHILFH